MLSGQFVDTVAGGAVGGAVVGASGGGIGGAVGVSGTGDTSPSAPLPPNRPWSDVAVEVVDGAVVAGAVVSGAVVSVATRVVEEELAPRARGAADSPVSTRSSPVLESFVAATATIAPTTMTKTAALTAKVRRLRVLGAATTGACDDVGDGGVAGTT